MYRESEVLLLIYVDAYARTYGTFTVGWLAIKLIFIIIWNIVFYVIEAIEQPRQFMNENLRYNLVYFGS